MSVSEQATLEARSRLLGLATTYGLAGVDTHLRPLAEPLRDGLEAVESSLHQLLSEEHRAADAARHLLRAGGKRVRPLICLLSAKIADEQAPNSHTHLVAAAAEAIHAATLLHDDVIDLGDVRRGAPTARLLYGNATSVLGGDLLMIRALAQVDQTGIPGLVASFVEVLARMIAAESLQLQRRGTAKLTRQEYFSIIEGKTAALFQWASTAGALSVSRQPDERSQALGVYGFQIGVAFQLRDDLLDLTGDRQVFGKEVVACVREGVVTYPLIAALEFDPELGELLESAAQGAPYDERELTERLLAAASISGGLETGQEEIRKRTDRALKALELLPISPAREALAAVARALAWRDR